jgi:hypothetical protein
MHTEHQRHDQQHDHHHAEGCGHESLEHEGHQDYLHDGHAHAAHEGHWDEHELSGPGGQEGGASSWTTNPPR